MIAAIQQAQQFPGALVEFMVAEGADQIAPRVQPIPVVAVLVRQQVKEADRRLVLEQCRDRRAGADMVAGYARVLKSGLK